MSFISLKCNCTFYPTFMTFCGALSNTFIFFNTMFQSLPTMMRFNFVHFNSLQTAHACSDYINLVYFCLSERQKQPEGTDMVNYEAKSDSQCVRNLPEVLELGILAVRKCFVFVLMYICVWVLSMRVALYSYSASRLLWIIPPGLNERKHDYFLTCNFNYNNRLWINYTLC